MANKEKSLAQLVAEGLRGQAVHNQEAKGIVTAVQTGTDVHLPVEAKQTLADAGQMILSVEGQVSAAVTGVAQAVVAKYGADEK